MNARGPFDAVIADSCGDVVPSGRLCVNKPSAVQHKLSSVVQTAIAPKGEAPVVMGVLVNSETRHRGELQPNLLETRELKR